MTIDAPDCRIISAQAEEIENLRSSLAAVDAKCRELRSERDAARRERDEARADLVAHEGMWRLTTKVLPDVAAERDAARREADAMANRFRIAGQEIDRLNAEAEALRWQIEHAGCAASGIGETTYNCRAESLCGLCRLRLDRDTARRERDEERRMKVEQYQRAQDYSREAGALRGVCQLLVEAAFVSETQFVCPNAFEPAVRAARRALSSSRPPSSEPRITFHGSGSDLATDVAALLTTAKLRGEFLDELRRKMPVTDAFVAPPESSSRPGADPKQPVALTPEDSRRLVEEGKALRDEVRKATERMRPKGIRAPTPETKPATRDGAKEESSSRPGADLRAEGFREGIEAAANLVDLSGPATIQKAALMREIRALQPAPCDGGAGAVRKCDCGALWAPWSPLDATCGCGRRRAAPTPETKPATRPDETEEA